MSTPGPRLTKPTANAGVRRLVGDSCGQQYQLLLPANRRHGVTILYVHGHGEDENAPFAEPVKVDLIHCLLRAGYPVASSAAHGNAWGNSLANVDYEALLALLVENYAINRFVVLSQSMGGISGLNVVKNRRMPQIIGWAGIYPACSLLDIHANHASLGIAIETAYGVPKGGDLEHWTSGHDPVTFLGVFFSGIRMRFYASDRDSVVRKSSNSDRMHEIVSPFALESSVVSCAGNHGDPTHFQPADILEFFARCFA
jgi:hypothetical protein